MKNENEKSSNGQKSNRNSSFLAVVGASVVADVAVVVVFTLADVVVAHSVVEKVIAVDDDILVADIVVAVAAVV